MQKCQLFSKVSLELVSCKKILLKRELKVEKTLLSKK